MDDYSDIIHRKRPEHKNDDFSVRHPKMSRQDRAKIFAPFAALRGYQDAIEEKEKEHVSRINGE